MAIIAASLLTSGIARAQTQAEINACFWDAVRLCATDPRDRNPGWAERLRIKFCMLYHINDVSPRFRAVFAAHGL